MSIHGIEPEYVSQAGLEVYADRYVPERCIVENGGALSKQLANAVIVNPKAVAGCQEACLAVNAMLAKVFRVSRRGAQ